MQSEMWLDIEAQIKADNWVAARALLEAELKKKPDDHWLITRLSLTYYEQFDYKRALKLSEQALAIAPNCPLVLWDYAGTLEMLEKPKEALVVYWGMVTRGVNSLANDECGEGVASARRLYTDCLYRMSQCYTALGDTNEARKMLKLHLHQRKKSQSIYPIEDVRKELLAIK